MKKGRIWDRKKRRMPCHLHVGQTEYNGLVLDLSETGLFIQTGAKAKPGQEVSLVLANAQGERIPLRGEVVRRKAVPVRLLSLAGGGLGVRILAAPESYRRFLAELGLVEPLPVRPPGLRFRVRVKQVSGPRTKRMDLEAQDADEAARVALEALGDEWKVLDVEGAARPA